MPDIGNTIQNTVIDTTMGVAVGETAGNIATDILLDELIDALVEQYAKASLQMQEKCDKYFGKYVEEDKKKRALLDAGKISKDDYRAWQNSKALGSKQWMDMRDTLAQDLTNCNEIAADIINDRKCDIYALNHNYGMYEIENNVGAYTSYTLYDHDTVERLIAQNPEILPKAKINIPKDLKWNKHLLTSAVTQGILQGESIPAIAKRMASVTDMDKDAAIRNARTATTGAQNAGRVDSYKHAEKLGIKVTQIWISTLDGRTRTSHRHLMGQKRPLGKPFSNGLLFPGDPNGPGWEVYNCRCTLIAEPDGSGYDLEKTIDKNLSKKGMTFDEWLNEQPLSKHYGESKQHYLERYAKHKQQLPFSDWLEETAAPDSVIQSVWGNKKMSQMYNEIKAQSVTDANKFYKELGKLGKPSEIWDKYLTGQLDAEDMKNFEDILKKYLPSSAPVKVADNISDAVKVADDVTKGKTIHPKAQESLDKIKWEKGPEMSFEDADMFHVNPKYTGYSIFNKIYSVNCQTCTFAYEARRQGYNIEALGKDINHYNTYKVQQKLGEDQANGWINTVTGKAPENLIDPMVEGTNNLFKQLDAAVGKNGERYTMGVRWKTGGAHAINVDRDAAGNIRIIDNQRSKYEKHIWTGEKEIKSYFDSVSHLRSVYRVDDCVPNFEYLNMIVKKSGTAQVAQVAKTTGEAVVKTITKQDLPANFDDFIMGTHQFKNKSTAVSDYLTKKFDYDDDEIYEYYENYVKGKVKDSKLDEIFGITGTTKTANPTAMPIDTTGKILDPKKKKAYEFLLNEQDLTDNDIKKVGGWENFKAKYGKAYGNDWTSKIDALYIDKPVEVIDKSQFANKKMSQVYTDIKMTDSKTANAFYKELQGMGKPSEVWDKYLKGELDPTDVQKIEKHLAKKYSGLEEALPGESVTGLDIDTLSKKKVTGVYNDFVADGDKTTANQYYNTLKKIANDKGYKSQGDVWKKYLAGELDFDDIEKIDKFVIKKYSVTTTTGPNLALNIKIDDATKNDLTKFLKAVEKQDPSLVIADKIWNKIDNEMAVKYKTDADTIWEKYLKGEIKDSDLDNMLKPFGITPASTKVDDIAEIKKTLPTVLVKLSHEDLDLYNKVQSIISSAVPPNMIKAEYWQKYLKGEIIDTDLDDVIKQHAKANLPDILKKTDLIDPMTGEVLDKIEEFEKIKKMPITNLDDMANKLTNDYYGLKVDDAKEILKGSGLNIPEKTAAANTTNNIAEIAKNELDGNTNWFMIYAEIMDIDLDLAHELKDIAAEIAVDKGFNKKYEVLSAYFDGTLKSTELDDIFTKIYKDKIPTAPTTASTFDKTAALSKYDNLVDLKYDLIDVGGEDLFNEINDELSKLKQNDPTVSIVGTYDKYKNGEISSKKLDDLFDEVAKKLNPTPVPAPTPTTASATTKATTAVDIDAIKNKKVTAIYNEIKADLGTSEANAFYNKTLKEIGSKNSWSQGEVWKKYLAGDLDADDVKKINDHLIKKYSKTVEPPKPTFDKSAFDTKKMSQVYNDIKATDTATANKFYNDLKKMGKPSEVWDEYLKGNLPQDKVDIIETHLKKKYTTAPSAQTTKAANTTQAAKKSDELIKAEEKLKKAQDELKATEKALKDNIPGYDHVYKGIWKDPVTLDDYEKKKSTIAAKKIYYDEEIDKLKNDPNYKSWLDSSAKSAEINKLNAYLYDLEEYDKLGQKAEKYLNDIEKAKNAVTKAQKEVQKYSPSAFSTSYTQERKNAALWPKSRDEADKLYMARSRKEWDAAKASEKKAIKEYTQSYHKFNEPLRGIEYGTNKYKGVGNTDLNASYANNGKMLNDMTDYLEKCVSDQDQWLQRGCGWGGMDKFLNVDMSLLQKGSEKELQNALLGKTITEYGFMSAGSAKGKGFSGDILFNIFAPKGTKMSYAELYSHYKGGSEVETILQQGSQFIITKVEKTKSQIYIDIELVNQLEPQRWKP